MTGRYPEEPDFAKRGFDWTWERIEIASTKVCGNCGGPYAAWMDLDEWVCFLCARYPERLP